MELVWGAHAMNRAGGQIGMKNWEEVIIVWLSTGGKAAAAPVEPVRVRQCVFGGLCGRVSHFDSHGFFVLHE